MLTNRARAALALLTTAGILGACSSDIGSVVSGDGSIDAGAARNDGGAGGDAGSGILDGASADGASVVCPPSWTTTPACGGSASPPGPAPDFGPKVLVFDPSKSMAQIQAQLDTVSAEMQGNEFGNGRYAYFFKPGRYALDVKVGFYTQLLGLGQSPDDVEITGAVRAKADWMPNSNATLNFWRGAENFAVVPTQAIDAGVSRWAVSQGTAMRRAHIKGALALDDNGWSSGGFIADSKIDSHINSGTQQQFLTRNVDLTRWQGQNWNMVFVGDAQSPATNWPNPPYTVRDTTPLVREKPFLYLDADGRYAVMVPALKKASRGASWASGAPPGSPLSIDRFYIAKPGADTAATLNAALAQGKHLLFTPGIYHLAGSVNVTRPGTVVMGIGFATLVADAGNAALSVADVDGVTIAGLLIEAGATSSPVLVQIGETAGGHDHAMNPTVLHDLHCRIGGANTGTAESCLTIHSHNVIVDNTWLWRADHGAGAAWTVNKGKNGLVVNGNDVTIYGLFVEHFQEYQTLWNGNGGSVYFYQSEMPYDPPSQADWRKAPGANGYPSYKVADTVSTHHAEGLGVYSVFSNPVQADNAIETPVRAGVVLHHMVSVSLAAGSINHIVNGTGGAVGNGAGMVADSAD